MRTLLSVVGTCGDVQPVMTLARIDRQKRALGHAIRRPRPSRAAAYLVANDLLRGRVIDYGCGFGFDADHFGWESYDPSTDLNCLVGPSTL